MIKVLNIMTDSNFGGAGRVLLHCLKCFDRSRFEVVVLIPKGGALVPLVKEEGYRVIETEHGHDRSWDPKALKEYCRIIKAEKPDIVHTHSAFSGKLAAWLCGVKGRIYTRHCVFDMPRKLTTFPGKQINGLINNTLSTSIVAVAHAAADNLTETGVSEKKITVIINGVEPMEELEAAKKAEFRRSLGIGEDQFVCLISARLEVYKGHSYLMETVKELQNRPELYKKLHFVVMGTGACKEEVEQQAKDLGIADKVLFTGFTTDIVPYCNMMDLGLNCSYGTEASSMALAEGMSLGKPAVVTDFGGNPYMITDGLNGLVVPQKDPKAMADAIARIAEDPALYKALCEGARSEYQKKFTAKVMTEQLEALYEKDLKN